MANEKFCYHCGAAHSEAFDFCPVCGRPLLLKKRYRVLGQLGAGGFGEVYHGQDTRLFRRPLALKRLLLSSVPPHEQQGAIESFLREGQILSSLRQRKVPRVYDHFIEQGDYYLVMKFIPGETLEDRLQRQGTKLLPLRTVLHIGIELATVLNYLHTRRPPVIFRDLKPANIMLTPEQHVYLIDFGIARLFEPGERRHTANLGTPGYASPEHYSLVTPLSDIYSLGAILHQLLSGEDPATHGLFQFPELHVHGPTEEKLADLVRRMVSTNVQDRPPDALFVKHELRAILQALSSSRSLRPGAADQSHPTLQVERRVQPRMPPLPAMPPPKVGELYYMYPHSSSFICALAWSPDGCYLAALGVNPAQIIVWEAQTRQHIATLTGFQQQPVELAWSPNSKRLAVAGGDHIISIWDPEGKFVKRYTGHSSAIRALAWSPRGVIASGDASKEIHLWYAAVGWRYRIFQRHEHGIQALAFSPDGKYLASSDTKISLHVYSSALGAWILDSRHLDMLTSLSWSPAGDEIVSGLQSGEICIEGVRTSSDDSYRSRRRASCKGHKAPINAIAWSPTGELIASASDDETVRLWYPKNAESAWNPGCTPQGFVFHDHTGAVKALAWSPDGSRLASAGSDPLILVWKADAIV